MASMEHSCGSCGNIWFDSEILRVCPACSSPNITNIPDEVWDKPVEDEAEEPLFI